VIFIHEGDPEFKPLLSRIMDHLTDKESLDYIHSGHPVRGIVTVGETQVVVGVPVSWPREYKAYYSVGMPVELAYDDLPEPGSAQGSRACSIGDLDGWLAEERDNRRLVLGGVVLAFISAAMAVLKHGLTLVQKASPKANASSSQS
jgi:hypothetical protein